MARVIYIHSYTQVLLNVFEFVQCSYKCCTGALTIWLRVVSDCAWLYVVTSLLLCSTSHSIFKWDKRFLLECNLTFLGINLNELCKSSQLGIVITMLEVQKIVYSSHRNLLTRDYDTVETTHYRTYVTFEPFSYSVFVASCYFFCYCTLSLPFSRCVLCLFCSFLSRLVPFSAISFSFIFHSSFFLSYSQSWLTVRSLFTS